MKILCFNFLNHYQMTHRKDTELHKERKKLLLDANHVRKLAKNMADVLNHMFPLHCIFLYATLDIQSCNPIIHTESANMHVSHKLWSCRSTHTCHIAWRKGINFCLSFQCFPWVSQQILYHLMKCITQYITTTQVSLEMPQLYNTMLIQCATMCYKPQ